MTETNKYRVAACMIIGDEYREDELRNTFKSLHTAGIYSLFIAYNGTKNDLQMAELEFSFLCPNGMSLTVEQFEWEDNFGKARQQSFDMVPKEEFDYFLWIDCDDIIVVDSDTSLDKILDSLDEYSSGIFVRYDYSIEPKTGKVVVVQWRERFLSTDVEWRWMHPIHEVALGPPGVQFAMKTGVHIEHQRVSGEERGARSRNRRILVKALRENPDEPRYHFYMAGETMAEAEAAEDIDLKRELSFAAIQEYKKFKEMSSQASDDFFIAQLRIAECYRMMGENLSAYDADIEAIAIYPDWPDAYIGAAKTCLTLGDQRRAIAYANVAMNTSPPNTPASVEAMNRNFNPLFIRAVALEQQGNFDDALRDYKAAKELWSPPNGLLDQKIEEIESRDKEQKVDKRKELRGSRPEKSIAFFTNPLFESWHPKSMKESGIGGAETCIIKLAPMFAADGWRVSVFGTPGEDRGVDENGVEWWDSEDYVVQEPFTVFVSSRSIFPFQQTKPNAKASILWMHDVNIGQQLEEIKDVPDQIVGLTNWHVNHMERLYGLSSDRFSVVPNGIDLYRFPEENVNRSDADPKFIWSSSPDRGLDTLISLWNVIKTKYPEATLDVFYGFDAIDKILEMYQARGIDAKTSYLEELKNKILTRVESLGSDSGINLHGRISQDDLAVHMRNANFWPYCTSFCETFCITGLEMQAAGVIPIASNLAALKETVANKEFMLEGWPSNVSYQREFLKKIDQALLPTSLGDETRINARQIGRQHAEKFTWDASYSAWNDLFSQMNVKV